MFGFAPPLQSRMAPIAQRLAPPQPQGQPGQLPMLPNMGAGSGQPIMPSDIMNGLRKVGFLPPAAPAAAPAAAAAAPAADAGAAAGGASGAADAAGAASSAGPGVMDFLAALFGG